MSSQPEHSSQGLLLRCPHCDRPLFAAVDHCPSCGRPLHLPNAATSVLVHPPIQWPRTRHGRTHLLPAWRVVLQVLPSGACLTLPAATRVLLGRGPALAAENLVDLDEHKGHQRGVSRRHCMLVREDNHLYVIDLGSSNGTLLNGEPLIAHRRYTVADGDKLVLGSMHLGVSFFTPGVH